MPAIYDMGGIIVATLRELLAPDGAARADAPATAETQHAMAVGDVFLGNLSDFDDQDWVRVELQPDTTYVIRLQGRGENPVNDPLLELYDTEGERVAFNDDLVQGGSLDSKIVFTTPCADSDDDAPALVYYINARSYSLNPALASAGDYRLSLSEQQPLAAPDTLPGVPDALFHPAPTVRGANDTHIGTDADDILEGRHGADTLDGRGQPEDGIGDTASYYHARDGVSVSLAAGRGYTGEARGDTLIDIENLAGSQYDDTLTGDGGENILDGMRGDDLLDGGPGADLLIGGHGVDTVTYRYAYSTHGVRVDLALGVADGSAAEGDTLIGIENIIGSLQDDELYGDETANRLHGYGGDDVLAGRGGADVFVFYHNGGHDTVLDFEPDKDTLELHLYGDGPDWRELDIRTEGEDAVIRIDEDNSLTLSGGATLAAALEEKHIVFVRETPPVRQESGQDDSDEDDGGADRGCVVGVTLTGDAGNNTLTGTECDDVLDGRGGADILDGRAGEDWAYYKDSSAGVTIDLGGTQDGDGYVTGSGGDAEGDKLKDIENLWGSAHNDTLTGDANANRLVGGAGKDTLDGGAGEDWAYYDTSDAGVTINLGSTEDGQGGHAEGDKLKNIEHLVGSDYDDTLTGDANANRLVGGAGKDTLDGGAGEDWAYYDTSDAGVTINLGSTEDGQGGHAEGDKLKNIERLVGSDYDDTLTGAYNKDNYLWGLDGDDTLKAHPWGGANRLYGGDGNDELTGGWGQDRLYGGAGGDTLDGGAGIDYAYYTGSDAGVTIDLSGTEDGKGGHAEGDKLKNIERLVGSDYDDTLTADNNVNYIWGLAGADTLTGADSADYLIGGDGNDTLKGLVNNDQMWGQDGNDTLKGGEDDDKLYGGKGDDRLYGGDGHDRLEGHDGNDTLEGGDGDDFLVSGSGDDTLKGGEGIDNLFDGKGDDTVDGGAGDDEIWAERGNDTLTGGSGEDTFYFAFTGYTHSDTITDFTRGEDYLDLVSYNLQGIGDSRLTITTGASDTVLKVEEDDSNHYVTITLQGVTSLDVEDFIFY